jgi:processive 1,2-diacylglycerol beta-glucosyltransferase
VTDLHPHGIWLWKGVDRYFTADAASASLVRKRLGGTPSSSFGIPVHPDFLKPPDRKSLLEKLALPDRKTVLLLSGGEGLGNLSSVLDSFSGFPGELSLIAIAGRNAGLLEECRRWAETHENRWLFVRTLGFVENMAEWMAVSDVVVTKPGGLTLFESLALGKPLVLLPARGGQEEVNRLWAVGAGVAVDCPEPSKAGSLLRRLFSEPGRLSGMEESAREAGCPEAAGLISREIVESLFPGPVNERRIS